jgi:hypothetical protein
LAGVCVAEALPLVDWGPVVEFWGSVREEGFILAGFCSFRVWNLLVWLQWMKYFRV